MPAPRVTGFYGANDHVVAVDVGGMRVERLGPDPVVGRPRETVMAMLERAAQQFGTADSYVLLYAED